jgi:DTW domain-containing protein YfiP
MDREMKSHGTAVSEQIETRNRPHRQRCYVCYRPLTACFCDTIPSIDNRTNILILQHVKERFHAFNTARIVKRALRNLTLLVDQTAKLAEYELPLAERTGVLYPGPSSQLLSDVPPGERPEQLIILDGTWHHAKTLMREIPRIQRLPRFRLDPPAPGNYRIRKEPTEFALSTVEATVQALQALEPDCEGLDQLLRAFDRMVDSQLQHPLQSARLRVPKRPWRRPLNIPSVLIRELGNVVVAYGESSYGVRGETRGHRRPIYWVAQRLLSGESFEAAIESPTSLSAEFLSLLELTENDFDEAMSVDGFRRAWRNFVRPTDTLVVYNHNTARLLERVEAGFTPSLALKSSNVKRDCRNLDEVLASRELLPPGVSQKGRAGKRLANAVAFAHYLSELGQSSV